MFVLIRVLAIATVAGCLVGGGVWIGGNTVQGATISGSVGAYLGLYVVLGEMARRRVPYPKARMRRRH